MKFTIDRDRWLRGEPGPGQLLRESDGKMCCLGFFARACGLPTEAIEGLGEPQEPLEHGFIGPVKEVYSRVIFATPDLEDMRDASDRRVRELETALRRFIDCRDSRDWGGLIADARRVLEQRQIED